MADRSEWRVIPGISRDRFGDDPLESQIFQHPEFSEDAHARYIINCIKNKGNNELSAEIGGVNVA
ncbi:MAG: hypothetical protein R3281_11910 [Balneolaceae bacterium]|nr:hypothetical protein [Balneolaceae bacterium]